MLGIIGRIGEQVLSASVMVLLWAELRFFVKNLPKGMYPYVIIIKNRRGRKMRSLIRTIKRLFLLVSTWICWWRYMWKWGERERPLGLQNLENMMGTLLGFLFLGWRGKHRVWGLGERPVGLVGEDQSEVEQISLSLMLKQLSFFPFPLLLLFFVFLYVPHS